jgi:hypothetical protein
MKTLNQPSGRSPLIAPPETQPEFVHDGEGIITLDRGGGYQRGMVMFANDTRFNETYYSEPLTNYLTGWRDPNNLEATLAMVAPNVPIPGRRFEYKQAVNAEEFLSESVDDIRAIGADFKHVVYTATDVSDKTYNRGLSLIVDLDDVGPMPNANVVPPWQQQKVAKLTRRLYRNELRRALAALSAAAVNVAYTWDKTNGVNPDMDCQRELINATTISGLRPNRVLFGDTAWFYRAQSFGAQNAPAGYMGYNPDIMDAMAAQLQVDRVYVSRERYQSSAASKSEILGSNVYLYFAEDDVDTEDPSNIKRFVSSFSNEQGGGLLRVYVQQISAKLICLSVEYYSKIVIPYSGGIRQMSIVGPN